MLWILASVMAITSHWKRPWGIVNANRRWEYKMEDAVLTLPKGQVLLVRWFVRWRVMEVLKFHGKMSISRPVGKASGGFCQT